MGTAAPSARVVAAWGRPWQELAHPRARGDAGGPPAPQSFRSAAIKSLALEVAPVGGNLIAAGSTNTPSSASLPGDRSDERRVQLRTTLPIGRVVVRPTSRPLAVHFMTDTATTGATIDIGWTPPRRA